MTLGKLPFQGQIQRIPQYTSSFPTATTLTGLQSPFETFLAKASGTHPVVTIN